MECDAAARLTFSQLAAIAVLSRFKLIKLLGQRRATTSELSQQTGMAKSTVHTHLQILERVGLVQRIEDERKWIYHALTPLGRSIASMDPLHLVVLFGAAVGVAFAGAVTMVYGWLHPPQPEMPWRVPPIGAPPDPASVATDTLLLGALVLVVGVVAVAVWWRWARCALAVQPDQLG